MEKERMNNVDEFPVHTETVKAGKRTYFFDVRKTMGEDYYLTITENRKCDGADGEVTYSRTKIFLYKEDFDKFAQGLADAVAHVKGLLPEFFEEKE